MHQSQVPRRLYGGAILCSLSTSAHQHMHTLTAAKQLDMLVHSMQPAWMCTAGCQPRGLHTVPAQGEGEGQGREGAPQLLGDECGERQHWLGCK